MNGLDEVANHANRREKISWERKMQNMQKLIEKLEPIDAQIQELMAEKDPILQDIIELRKLMVTQCIHPRDSLVEVEHEDMHLASCKFCNKKIRMHTPDIEQSTL